MPSRRPPPHRDDIVYDDDAQPRKLSRAARARAGSDADWADSAEPDPQWLEGRASEEHRVQRELDRLRRNGAALRPELPVHERNLSTTFWGQAWNRNLMAYSDYESRMPRGRSYFRAGKVMDLTITPGRIVSIVAGTRLYDVNIAIAPLPADRWEQLKARCLGRIGGLMELLSGSLSDEVMREVTDPGHGLFPSPQDIKLSCTCPDYAGLCKHLAATLYATGSRFDTQPALLFSLRGVDPQEMIAGDIKDAVTLLTAPAAAADLSRSAALDGVNLAGLFDLNS